jgi:polysaccharide biosynthesis/export protein
MSVRKPHRASTTWEFITPKLINSSRLLVLSTCLVSVAFAQQKPNSPPNVSELAVQNMNRVAAPAAEIKTILLKDSGLMVELRRWIAKDSTEHGQVVGEAELNEDAIFERLESDVQFRSAVTLLLQKYGYFQPKLNPDSDLAKEQELLRIERTKWLAQAQEEERVQERQKAATDFRRANACDAQHSDNCNALQPNPPIPAQGGQNGSVPLVSPPPDETIPTSPTLGQPQLQRTEFALPGNSSNGPSQYSQLSLASSTGASSQSGSSATGGFGGLGGLDASDATNGQLAGLFSNQNPGMGGSPDALSPGYGGSAGSSSGTDMSALLMNAGQPNSLSAPPSPAPLMPMQPNPRSPQPGPIPADMVRRPNPYEDVPSLADMYMQTVARPSTPKRFGMEVFQNGSHDLQLIPMDLPAGPDYVVGPGDGLTVDLWGSASMRLIRTVDRGGQISLPEVGPVEVSGKNLASVQQDVQRILKSQYRDVSVGVSLSRLRTIRVYEVGDVISPGAYDISSLSTPLNALFVAGGPSQRGSLRILKHYRGNQLVQTVDVYDLLLHGVKANIERLENGDTVQVPPMGPQVTLEGTVRRPAIYELHDEKNLEEVLELAGGLLPTAALRHIEVQRLVAHDKDTMLSLDIPDTSDPREVTKQLESFAVQDGDRIRVYPIAPYNRDTIFLEGHVVRPGRYSYRDSMRVTDVIASYQELLPEPATQYAEIIRLNAPDFRPSVESFSLKDALEDPAHAPLLHPMDTVRIFSRFDFENPPTVAVVGDVRMPGDYKTAGQIHLSDAVHLAGGLSEDAETTDAQVFRYMPDGKLQVFSVNLNQALEGNQIDNIVLEPRDRLLIHRNPDAVERATVYVKGEVGKPGRYPLTTNMRIADLIRVGGGLAPSADAQTADLTVYEWSDKTKLAGHQQEITISAALAGDAAANLPLHNGDVLTIRQLPGWNDLGASITVKGEVKFPGVYGIRPGEKLSSILERAGGLQSNAYPYGAVLQRVQVREIERRAQDDLILRAKSVESNIVLMPENDPRQKQAKETALQQYQTTLAELTANPPPGRVSIRISSEIRRWKNTSADVEVRAGDTLTIPKRPSYVMVSGQVFNPTAVAFRPGKSAKWYLNQAGGPTLLGNKKEIFVIRADGTVLGEKKNLIVGDSMSAVLLPGDSVVVPERAIGGPVQWQTIFTAAQVAGSVATSIFLVLHY